MNKEIEAKPQKMDECVSNGNVDTIFEKIFVEYIDLLSEKGGDE